MRFHRLSFALRTIAAVPGDNDNNTVSPESTQPAGEGTLKEAPHLEIGNVLLGELCLSHGIIDTCFRHQKEDVDEILLLCQVKCKLPGCHGEEYPNLDWKGLSFWDDKVLRSLQCCNLA